METKNVVTIFKCKKHSNLILKFQPSTQHVTRTQVKQLRLQMTEAACRHAT